MIPSANTSSIGKLFHARLANAASDTERIDCLNEWGWFKRDFDLASSQALAEQAIALATADESSPYARGVIAGLRTTGYLQVFAGKSEISMGESLRALEWMETLPCPDLEMDIRCNLIWAYLQLGELEQAMQYALNALDTAHARRDRWGQVLMLDAIGNIYINMGEAADALENSLRGLALLREMGDVRSEGAELNNIATHYLQLGNHDAALECVNASLNLAESAGYPFFYINALGTKGEIYLARREYTRAVELFEQALNGAQQYDMHLAWVANKLMLGQLYHHSAQPQLAIQSLRAGLARAAEHKIRFYETSLHLQLAELLEEQNDFQNALAHYKTYQELREQVIYKSSRRVNSLTILNRLKVTQRMVEHLHRETETLRAELRENQRRQDTLSQLATQDPLTGISNRRHLVEQIEQILQAQSSDACLALILIDVDNFKDINDTYGHLVGDTVLQLIVSQVRAQLRPQDVPGRLGGDEFALLLPDTCGVQAQNIGERLRVAVENNPVFHANTHIQIHISVGVAHTAPGQRGTVAALLETADRALYQVKRSGRNQTIDLPMTQPR